VKTRVKDLRIQITRHCWCIPTRRLRGR